MARVIEVEVTKVRFEAFKSLYDVTCDLDQFTVITGPNGAGKSNLVDALNFIGEVYEDGLEFAVARAGGYDNIAHRRSRRAKRNVGMKVECRVSVSDIQRANRRFRFRADAEFKEIPQGYSLTYRHAFSMMTATQAILSDFEVKEDTLEVWDGSQRVLRVERDPKKRIKAVVNHRAIRAKPWLSLLIDPFTDDGFIKFFGERPQSSIGLMVDRLFYGGLFTPVREALAGIRVFQLSPFLCRAAGTPTPNAVLERHGENLPGAANHLRRNDPRAWQQVEAGMRAIIPSLLGIDIVYTEDRRLALQFKEQGVGRAWNTGEVSDGTIQALALLIALYDRRNPLLVIEEPENSVHPWILRQFLNLCRSAPDKQIVMTSHSPVLLNYVEPKSVRLMSISAGRSNIHRLIDMSTDLRKSVLNGELSLFDVYDSGAIREAVPRGFSEDSPEDDE